MRIRSRLRQLIQKPKITVDEWDKIHSEAEAAQELLSGEQFQFFRDYLKRRQTSITEQFVKNKIKPVSKHNTISETVKAVLHISKEEQENEMSGQYKLIDEIFADLQLFAMQAQEAEEAEKAGRVELERSGEK